MEARRLKNGNLLVPMAAEGPGGALFDGVFEIGPGHPDYEGWLPFVEKTGKGRYEERSGGPKPEAG